MGLNYIWIPVALSRQERQFGAYQQGGALGIVCLGRHPGALTFLCVMLYRLLHLSVF